MRSIIAALAFLALAGSTASAAPPQAGYVATTRDLGELAVLNSRVVRFEDLEGDWPFPPGLLPTEKAELETLARHRGINGFRNPAALELAAKLMPDCSLEPTAADLAAFYPYWRTQVAREQARLAEMGYRDDAQVQAMLDKIGLKAAPAIPLAEMAKVDGDTPGAEAGARIAIREWKLEHCIQARFGGDRFFGTMVGRDGAWPVGPVLRPTLLADGRAIPIPELRLEALTARGRYFHKAQVDGLLIFRNLQDSVYFFSRYEGVRYDTIKDDAAATAFLGAPPWMPSR